MGQINIYLGDDSVAQELIKRLDLQRKREGKTWKHFVFQSIAQNIDDEALKNDVLNYLVGERD